MTRDIKFSGNKPMSPPGAKAGPPLRAVAAPPPAWAAPGHVASAEHCSTCDIRHLSICSALETDELANLEAIVSGVVIPSGKLLFDEGDKAEHVYNVTRGTIRLFKALPDGRRQITGFLLPGDFLGLSARDGYAYSAEAVNDTELCRFPIRDLKHLFDRFPKLEARLLEVTGDELAAAQDQMLLLGRKTPVEKICSFLLNLSRRAERWSQPTSPVVLPMSRGDIADYLGLTVETVSRTFTKLKGEGAIELPESSRVILADIERLEELAAGD